MLFRSLISTEMLANGSRFGLWSVSHCLQSGRISILPFVDVTTVTAQWF